MKAGAVACEIASLSWSMSETLSSTSRPGGSPLHRQSFEPADVRSSVRSFRSAYREKMLHDVILGIDPRLDFLPGAEAPKVQARLRLSAEGLRFRELVQDLRFEMASDLLAKSNASMAAIAELLGYSDQAVFSRAFSNRYGHPPSRLRATKYSIGQL